MKTDFENIHPGYYIKDFMVSKNITLTQLSDFLGISKRYLYSIISGKKNINRKIAISLSDWTNTSVNLWVNMMENYDKK